MLLEYFTNSAKIHRTFGWVLKKRRMIKIVQYLIKSIPNYSSIRKSWEVALGSLATQGSNTPLQSKDIALFQRDWDLLFFFIPLSTKFVERHCPVPKGLRLNKSNNLPQFVTVERHCPVPKGLRHALKLALSTATDSRKTLPCSKGIETYLSILTCTHLTVERHCPVPKGLRPVYRIIQLISNVSRKTLPCSKGIETGILLWIR